MSIYDKYILGQGGKRMDKLFTLLMIVLFTVAITGVTIYDKDGMQNDAKTMKTNTQTIIKEANTSMENFK